MKKIVLILLACLISGSNYTCGYDGGEYGYSFYITNTLKDPSLLYFVNYKAGLWFSEHKNYQAPADANLSSWAEYLGNGVEEKDVAELLYKASIEDIETYLSNKKELAKKAQSQKVLAVWKKKKKLGKAMGKYLIYAKECEKEATKSNEYWDKRDQRNEDLMLKLLAEGKSKYSKEKDAYLKERYAFQVLRLQFYLGEFETVLSSFKSYFPTESKNPSYIYYRALELKAGALERRGDAEAPYLYAKVFANCPDRQASCVSSFSLTSRSFWENSINLCKNDEEKIVYYTLRALQPAANIIEELEYVVELNPNSPFAELLVARYLEKVQHEFFPHYYNTYKAYPRKVLSRSQEFNRLRAVCQFVTEKLKANDFWKVTYAHTELMLQNFDKAMQICAEVDASSDYSDQAKITRFAAQLCSLRKIDNNSADAIWSAYKDNEQLFSYQMKQFMQDVFAYLYHQQGDFAKAFLVQNELADLSTRLDLPLIKDIEAFFENCTKPSLYERYLLKERAGENRLDDIKELKGVYYLQRNQLDLAIEALEQCSASYQKKNNYFNNPYIDKTIWTFAINPHLFYLDIEAQPGEKLYLEYPELNKSYNLLSLARQLKSLEQKAEAGGPKAAEYYFLLGLAWYNLSPSGWHRPALYFAEDNGGNSYWNSARDPLKKPKHYKGYTWNVLHHFNPNIGVSYLQKAMDSTNDAELKAKACYLAAKIERVEFGWLSQDVLRNSNYSKLMKQLKRDFDETKFFYNVSRECYDLNAL